MRISDWSSDVCSSDLQEDLTLSRKNLSLSSRVLGTFLGGALALAACGNSGDDDVDAADAPGTTEAAESGSEDSGEGSGEFQAISGVPGVTDDELSFAVLSTGESNPLGYCLLACIRTEERRVGQE